MFWDKISGLYDLFENIYNRKVYTGTGRKVAEYIEAGDEVLECACGTGAISIYIAPKCKKLTATDFSEGMLKQASKKCRRFSNITIQKADITKLDFADAAFDKVVAGNVIHLLLDLESYKQFFTDMGYSDIEYEVVDGRMPCAVAVIKN